MPLAYFGVFAAYSAGKLILVPGLGIEPPSSSANAIQGDAGALAAIFQAILFGAAHPGQGPAGMVIVGLVGLVFGLVYLRAGRNLWPVILTHGIADSLSFTLLYFGVTPS